MFMLSLLNIPESGYEGKETNLLNNLLLIFRQQQVLNVSLHIHLYSAQLSVHIANIKMLSLFNELISLNIICLPYTRCLTDHIKDTVLTAFNLWVLLLSCQILTECVELMYETEAIQWYFFIRKERVGKPEIQYGSTEDRQSIVDGLCTLK